jgi:hypothetical protein
MEFQVVELDVWGNSEDGYDVNDVYVTDEVITITEDATDKEIGDWLREHLYPNLPAITIDGDYEFSLYIDAEEDGMPLLELRRVR